jgi:Uma2 family endonuclease
LATLVKTTFPFKKLLISQRKCIFALNKNDMGLPAEGKKYYTVEEYFQQEEDSEIRSEFYKGELFPIEVTTRRHNDIVFNVANIFRSVFRKRGCNAYSENVKIETIKGIYYPYPDVMLTCDPDDNDNLIVKNPVLITEVLSPGTADYDRGFKWLRYRKMPSLRYYMIISQSEMLVEVFSRKDNNALWTLQYFTDSQDVITFESLDFELSLTTIYEFVELDDLAK